MFQRYTVVRPYKDNHFRKFVSDAENFLHTSSKNG